MVSSSRRKSNKYGRQRPAEPAVLWSSCVELIRIDAEPLRRREKKRYQDRCRDFEEASKALRTFEDQDMPAFMRWLEREFARPLTALRKCEAQVRELYELIHDVERYADWQGVSEAEALKRIRAARAAGEEEALWRDEAAEADRAADEDAGSAAWNDLFSKAFAEASGEGEDDEAAHGARARKGASGSASKQQDSTILLKSVYRQLVRALHPDTNPDATAQAYWQEVQDAYAWGDLERLLRLQQTILQSDDGRVRLETAPIGDLINLRKAVEARLRKVRRSLREAKQHPAWEYARAAGMPNLLRRLKRDLNDNFSSDLDDMRFQLAQLEEWMERWHEPKRRSPYGGRSPRQKSPGKQAPASGRRRRREAAEADWAFEDF